ncbi:MAG TPA: glycoside hydrolase family 3 N-terminal domain-containing protein, partial [Streptosporangiaceae bacterium]
MATDMTMTPPGRTSDGSPTTSPVTTTDPPADGDASPDRAAAALVARLPVSAKIALLTGADSWRVPGSPEIGLRPIVTSDGPAGVRGVIKDERSPSTSLPCPSALGATWDPSLVLELGAALGREARGKAVDVLLAPTINLMRTPLGGRGFECFAEDPVLTAELAVAYVRGVQSAGVAATVKHFAGNDSETQRWTYDARIAETVLRELYLVPFEAAVKAGGALAVMAAYNGVNGATMTTSEPLLRGVLKGEWGFDGVVMSDWHAARQTVATALGGLDLVMPGPDGPWGDQLAAAVADGRVSEAVLDDKVLRLLRLARRVGALVDADSHVAGSPAAAGNATAEGGPVAPELLRRAAAASFVLLRNEAGALPLDPAALSRVTVAGPNAFWPTIQGGGSAGVMPAGVSAPADAIRAALAGRVAVEAAVGCQTWESVPAPRPGS